MSHDELDRTTASLDRLAEWFENFGNYTRADDCRRLADGLRLYRDDITRPDEGR